MKSGREKAQMLLSLLGHQAKNVLQFLTPENAHFLSSSIEDAPHLNSEELSEFLKEILIHIEEKQPVIPPQDVEAREPSPVLEPLKNQEEELAVQEEPLESETPSEQRDRDERLRSPEQIAAILTQQPFQVAAFILSKLEEDKKAAILENLSLDLRDTIEKNPVEFTPLSDKIFQNVYEQLFYEPLEEENPFSPPSMEKM